MTKQTDPEKRIDHVFMFGMVMVVCLIIVLIPFLITPIKNNDVIFTVSTNEKGHMAELKGIFNVLKSATDEQRMQMASVIVSQAESEDRELTKFEKLQLLLIMEMHRRELEVKAFGA